jgi:hypothetical protein
MAMTDEQIKAVARDLIAATQIDALSATCRQWTDLLCAAMNATAAIAAMPDRYAAGVADERARVVGYLRERPAAVDAVGYNRAFADAIEAGEHLK